MRGLGAAFLVRRARSSWLLLACVAVTVLVATGLAAAEWTFAAEAIQPGAQSFLAAPQNRVIRLSGVVNTGEAAADTRLIRATLRKAWPGVGFQMQSALWAEPIQLSTSASGTFSTQIQPASLEGISARVTLTAGTVAGPAAPRWSGAGGAAGRRGQPAARDRGLGAHRRPRIRGRADVAASHWPVPAQESRRRRTGWWTCCPARASATRTTPSAPQGRASPRPPSATGPRW